MLNMEGWGNCSQVRRFLAEKWIICLTIVPVVCVVLLKKYYDRIFAFAISRVSKKIHAKLFDLKKELFSQIQPGQKIVEIGAGAGANFQFYPEGCSLTCVEPKKEFESYLNDAIRKKAEHLYDVSFVQGTGETLSEIVAENSIDCVVCTLVFCSVQNELAVAQEIRKVLKPGGKFCFLEHVVADRHHRKTRILQHFVSFFTRKAMNNCHTDGEPWKHIQKAGFSQFQYDRINLNDVPFYSPVKHLCMGTATK